MTQNKSNPFLTTDACVSRLLKEYDKHKSLIIACDFDNTVYDYYNQDTDYTYIVEILKQCSLLNFHIVIFTAADKDRWEGMQEYCQNLGFKVSSINKNPVELPFGHHGKIYYNLLLDDRAGLGQSLEILEQVLAEINDINNN